MKKRTLSVIPSRFFSGRIWRVVPALVGLVVVTLAANAQASGEHYTVNGHAIAPEMAQLLGFYGMAPGDYYIDTQGNYGQTGQPPTGNFNGGPPRGWQGEPKGIRNNPYAQAYVNGVTGLRIFWVYSPSMFSGATGGSSGYYHICPDNRYFRSSEGAISVDNPSSWGGVAGTHRGGGRWRIGSGENGPTLVLNGSDGSHIVALATLAQGRFKVGQTSYAVEANKASCP